MIGRKRRPHPRKPAMIFCRVLYWANKPRCVVSLGRVSLALSPPPSKLRITAIRLSDRAIFLSCKIIYQNLMEATLSLPNIHSPTPHITAQGGEGIRLRPGEANTPFRVSFSSWVSTIFSISPTFPQQCTAKIPSLCMWSSPEL